MPQSRDEVGQASLLDAWVPPPEAGQPFGCFATSYTFDSVFFEEECLGRFVGLRAESSEASRSLEWIIECEEKFSQIKAVALVDKANCRGRRSPRWDLVCARSEKKSGIMHAKLSLLIWARHMRLIVASANLTQSGYRQNREIFLALEANPDLPLDKQAWDDALEYLRVLSMLGGAANYAPIKRVDELLEEAEERLQSYSKTAQTPDRIISFHGLGPDLGPDRPSSLFQSIKSAWPDKCGVVRDAFIVSPFFDPNNHAAQKTIASMWGMMAERGEVRISLSAPLECDKEKGNMVMVPSAWSVSPRDSGTVQFLGVKENDEEAKERRSLHAKAISLENDYWMLTTVGSANMTASGTGIGQFPNWEATVSVLIQKDTDRDAAKQVEAAWQTIEGELIEAPIFPEELKMENDDSSVEGEALPMAFEYALYRKVGEEGSIEVSLRDGAPAKWELKESDGGDRVIGETEWRKSGSPIAPLTWTFPLKTSAAPSGFEVAWQGSNGTAWLPVCAADGRDLPPPEELRNIPLELLIEILTTARPLAMTAAAFLRRTEKSNLKDLHLDPHQRVSVRDHLIPKMRRASAAIAALREKLSQPAVNVESLEWRLNGPFGAAALLSAVEREWKNPEENRFFTAELCLELSGIRPAEHIGYLSKKKQSAKICSFLREQIQKNRSTLNDETSDMISYTERAFAEAEKQMEEME